MSFPESSSLLPQNPFRGQTLPCLLVPLLLALLLILPESVRAENPVPPNAPAPATIGQLLELSPVINADTFSRVSRVALNLRQKAAQASTKGILVLKIQEGLSRYGDVRELAKFIASEIPEIRTVAWIPQDLRGTNAIIALACHEIVMSPQARLGDIARGEPIDPDTQAFILSLVNLRRNPLLSEALALGMLDRQREVIWVRLKTGPPEKPASESRVILEPEFQRIIQAKSIVEDQQTIKPAGGDGMFQAARCRELNILTSNLFDSSQALLSHYQLKTDSLREQFTAGTDLKVAVIRIHGIIDNMYEEYLHRQIERQVSQGTNLLIFEVDSPGGMLEPCVRLAGIFAECSERKVRTVAYVPRQAISGGAIVSFGCDEIYLHPSALIGDAQPIEVRPGEAFHAVPEKIVSKVAQDMKLIADRKHRSAALLQAMVDKNLEVFRAVNRKDGRIEYLSDLELNAQPGDWDKGPLVPESKAGMILTVNGQRAHELGLAEPTVNSFEELKQRLGIPPDTRLVPLAPMFVDRLVFLLNSRFITGLLLFVGIVCIYMEMHVPSGIFAIGGVLCFALFFWSRFLGGTAGWLEVTLFLLGMLFLALETFVIPGFGIFGLSGGLLVIASLILAGQTFLIPVSHQDYTVLSRSVTTLGLSVAVFTAVALSIGRFLPRSRLWDHMVLVPPGVHHPYDPAEPRLSPELTNPAQTSSLVGAKGLAVSILRPSGRARIGDDFYDVRSEGPYIEQGAGIEVVSIEGNRIVVRRIT